jgi:hypothetical protein
MLGRNFYYTKFGAGPGGSEDLSAILQYILCQKQDKLCIGRINSPILKNAPDFFVRHAAKKILAIIFIDK